MVSEPLCSGSYSYHSPVLILVLVEDGLGGGDPFSQKNSDSLVLILVLVEDGLGEAAIESLNKYHEKVLILVLVEDGLGGWVYR